MREVLTTQQASRYFEEAGLRVVTGLPDSKWTFAAIKELLDNALDAVDELQDKRVEIHWDSTGLHIHDSGSGISVDDLDRVFDFNVFASSKRDFRTVTRGFQGNALKAIIGISHLRGWSLKFFSGGQAVSYELNDLKFTSGQIVFEKAVASTEESNGVAIEGLSPDEILMDGMVWTYRLANPDVTFVVNGEAYPVIAEPTTRADKTFIQWYDLEAFGILLQKIHTKDPKRTVKAFCSIFSGTQRIMSSLQFPYKRLDEFANDKRAIKDLYERLRALTAPPKPTYLAKMAPGKEVLFKTYGVEDEKCRYKCIRGSYQKDGAEIPYQIEAVLFYGSPRGNGDRRVITAVNRSVPYNDPPFRFESSSWCAIAGKEHFSNSLKGILDQSGFNEASGMVLYVNFMSPHLTFTDSGKTNIIADAFKDDLLKVVDYCCKPAIEEVRRARKARAAFNRANAIARPKRDPKKELMRRHFMEAYEVAAGGYTVTIRQVFYKVREIVNLRYGVELNTSDYSNTFTQKLATRFFEKYPELEQKIFFERRGFFKDPFYNEDVPLGTADVLAFISNGEHVTNRIYTKTARIYDIPIELKYNRVLFIEKQGFNHVLEESGLVKELNIGVMSTQGFSTRAAKKLIRWFLTRGFRVYVLHDCDIPGYLIHDKMRRGSDTFQDKLDVEDIGLTVEDVKDLALKRLRETTGHQDANDLSEEQWSEFQKRTAETKRYEKKYTDALKVLNRDERDFFLVDRWAGEYRRVELNALTNPEFIDLIRRKIGGDHRPVRPTVEQLGSYLDIDEKEILMDAFYRVHASDYPVNIDRKELAERIHAAIKNGEHWTRTMRRILGIWKEEQVDRLATAIRG